MIGARAAIQPLLALAAPLILLSACEKAPAEGPAKDPGEDRAAQIAATRCPPMPQQDYRWIAGGTLIRGSDARLAEEMDRKPVDLSGFWLAAHEVTNGEFAEFVSATGYITLAERPPPATHDAPHEKRQAGSAVFTVPLDGNPNWWRWIAGANWRQPGGPDNAHASPAADPREPVVHIAYEDARAFAAWKGMMLPSEDQWEWAALSGGADPDAPRPAKGKPGANTYQGSFPLQDQGSDGFAGRAPVACFPADTNGIYDLIGNVWEWTSDAEDSERNIIKGGSFLCAANYCARYRPAARQFQERSLGTDHIGFRLIDTARPAPAP